MAKKEEKTKPSAYTEEIEYEKFSDYWAIIWKKGMFALCLGQQIYEPPKLFAKFWLDSKSFKELSEFMKQTIEEYEKEHGKIE